MSDIKYNGGPAFPFSPSDESTGRPQLGMTLRDYFAAAAMQGMMANKWNVNYTAWSEHAMLTRRITNND
jgi:hypothetical protein